MVYILSFVLDSNSLEGHMFVFLIMSLFGRASLVAQLVNNVPAMQESPVQLLGPEDPLEKG